jgi:hypothetical protein
VAVPNLLADIAREKLEAGLLPRDDASKVWSAVRGPGSVKPHRAARDSRATRPAGCSNRLPAMKKTPRITGNLEGFSIRPQR